jgi:hypothetical protein
MCLVAYTAKAQEQSKHQLFVGAASVDYQSTPNNLQMQMQVGNPLPFSFSEAGTLKTTVGFPYGILYISPTFVIDGFEVSKGYFRDRVNIKWEFGANQERIEKVDIYRKELGSNSGLQRIGSVSKDVFEYNDIQAEGGVLYQYKIQAVGTISGNELYINYIEGIGFRNPTATVSGSVSFEGGNPVKDVIVYAEADGADNNFGSSLKFSGGIVEMNNIEYEIPTNNLTLQTWVTASGYIMSLRSTNNGDEIQLNAGKFIENDVHSIGISVLIKDVSVSINDRWETVILKDSYPTGKLDPEGNDVFKNISSLTDTSFIHLSAVLEQGKSIKVFINGREITQDYIDGFSASDAIPASGTEDGIAAVLKPELTLRLSSQNYNLDTTIDKVILGQGFNRAGYTGHLDEVRIWQRALSSDEIRRDYRRYLSGGENGLSIYLRMDEKEGTNVYDFSKKGFRQNKNDGYFVNDVAFSLDTPTKQQLGVFGVTDKKGSYTISSIAYSGTGESFVISPSLGVHKFEPASQTLFLGEEENVVNQLNFKDISSFQFNGKVVYNTQGVFNSTSLGTTEAYTDIEDFGYNKYRAVSNGAETFIDKGQYYYEGDSIYIDSSNNTYKGGELKKYNVVAVENAYVYVDDRIVIGSNNQPVQTDHEGKFTINVPIGDHKVEVRKDGHTFAHSGYFPASGTFNFVEDQLQETWFIDTTRISLVGKVVGGKIESDKPVGFGLEGAFSYLNNKGEENEEIERISSKNNIGIATITLKGKDNSNDYDVFVKTDSITGEYKVSLIPYIYKIKPADLKVPSNTALDGKFLTSTETLNYLATPVLDSIKYTTKDGTELFSEAFHHKKSFRYNAPTTLKQTYQEYETTYPVGDEIVEVSNLAAPLYKHGKDYSMVFEVTQDYINKDAEGNHVETKEYYNEGKFLINNNLTTGQDVLISFDTTDDGVEQYSYKFTASKVNDTHSEDYKNSIAIKYKPANTEAISISNKNEYKYEGIVVGPIEPEGKVFVTVAPEVPDIILRDPPGSNSFASIEKGTTISFKKSNSKSEEGSVGVGVYVSLAPTFTSQAGSPIFKVETEVNAVLTADTNFSTSQQLNQDGSSTETYEFKNTISTSDSPLDVGAGADLYIGNAKNQYYGITNNMFITKTKPLKDGAQIPHIKVQDANNNDLYISFQETYFIAEQPTNTFFVYTQNHIIKNLIPSLDSLRLSAPEVLATTSADPNQIGSKNFYKEQISLWKKIIQDNERDKYLALHKRDSLKTERFADIADIAIQNAKRQSALDSLPFILQREYALTEFDTHQTTLNNLFASNFESNISIDAGVGAYTSSVSTSIIASKSYTKTIDLSTEFEGKLGLLIQNLGQVGSITGTSSIVDETSFSTDKDLTTTISYTLKDNDTDNFLSVDVVNLFDGYGPIFITKGGATSCPNEPVTVSEYYKHATFNEAVVGGGGEELNAGTVSVYGPEIIVEGTSTLTNIPESEGALFMLKLKNNSVTKTDLIYTIGVNAVTLNGATTNIAPNGLDIFLPYNDGKPVEFPFEVYKSSASSTFEYDAIEVYLKSPCLDAYTSVNVSVAFKPSCSKVTVSAPQDNWIFNRAEGFSKDASGNTTTNKLPITFTDFNTNFSGFKKIELQYRNASSANWMKLKTYYGTQAILDEAGDASGEVISPTNSEYTFNWDIIGDKIADGNYEFRGISFCTNNVTNVSPIVQGVVNLNAPVQFGTPQPSDGILDVGEDISLRFNEDVYMNGAAVNFVKFKGFQNQQEIDHSVSVYLDGGVNQIELPNQILPNGAFTIQFWYNNDTTGSGNLISQENGINASLIGNQLTFSVGGASITASINATQYNFYSLVYQSGNDPQLLIFENGSELKNKVLTSDLDFNSNSSIFIGGSNVIGNIHDFRFWSKTFTSGQANVSRQKTLTGRELNLLGYWPLDEGHGKVGIDKAKSRNAIVNLIWDIKPKGTAYTFANNAYLSLENVGFVQPSVAEDITLSFWIKTATTTAGTIFSNGKGNNEELSQTNGFKNKWSVNMKSDGNLELMSENISYNLTAQSIADNSWHHVALVVKRGGSINAYVDALETSSVSSVNIGGFSGNKILLGARLYEDFSSTETIDNYFTGSLDEIRLWNTARSFEQIKRDRYFEIERTSEGLMLYADFNKEDGNTSKGPKYNHVAINNTVTSTFSILSGTTAQSYTLDSPALKPKLKRIDIPFTTVINGDQMIIQPSLTAEQWSLYEGQILDFSVSNMIDEHFNKQSSAITWSAYVNRQEIEWFTINQTKEVIAEKKINEAYSFTMDIVNKGGSNQAYTISGLPTWITVRNSSGSVAPNATKQVNFIVDAALSMGTYNADIYLETGSEFNDRLTLSLRVLTPAPDWSVNAPDYSNSMNVIGKIKINEVFSRDQYTKIGAFVDNNPRGEGYLKYDTAYDSYFVYLTAYSNVTSGEEITFKIWDAINGQVLIAAIDSKPSTSFLQNEILGSKSTPVLFSGARFSEQTLALNKGWTWTSFYVEDGRFNNIKTTFAGLTLQTGDQIKSQNDFTNYESNDWFGSLTTIANNSMYKVKLAAANALVLIGNDVDEANVNLAINEGWNWLPFPIHRNISIEEALSFYNPSDGDVIKDQYTFAIYDTSSGWSGTLNYMQSNRGYMMKSGASQTLNYPNSANAAKSDSSGQEHAAETIALFSKYNANMSIVAEIIASDKFTEVLVYDAKGVLRGVSPIVSLNNKKVSFIAVFSNANDVLKFKLSDGITAVDITTGFVFENNKVLGSLNNPVILSLESLSTDDLFLNNIVVYPNPFSNKLTVSSINQIEKVAKIEVYSAIGALITRVLVKTDETIIDTASFAKGIYLIKLTSDAGHMIIKKMVKQ